MGVPKNYRKHVERDTLDPGGDQGMHRAQMLDIEKPAYTYGLFLKANSALVGPSEGVELYWPGEPRRIDHEVELAVVIGSPARCVSIDERSEEHTSELQSLMRISYAVFCLKKKKQKTHKQTYTINDVLLHKKQHK